MAYYQSHGREAGAGKFVIEAAWEVAKLKKAQNDGGYRQWFKNTVTAWDAYAKGGDQIGGKPGAQQPPYVDYAAEADFTLLDEEVTAAYDVPSKHTYSDPKNPSAVADILGSTDPKAPKKGKYQTNAEEAQKWDAKLDALAKKYSSLEWVPAIRAREGALFDTLRTGLYNTVKVKILTSQQEKMLDTMRNSGRQDLMDKADQLEDAAKDFWRNKKQQELDGADQLMVRWYATAVAYARKYNVRNPQVNRAIGRLAYYTDIIGDAKMGSYVTSTNDPTSAGAKLSYSQGMYVQTRPGLASLPPPNGDARPLPAAP
jgi:hypothetical protein